MQQVNLLYDDIILMYLRKSRQDSDAESVEETLARHEQILQDYALRVFGYRIPDKYIFREVVSGETIAARPMMQQVLNLMESDKVKGVLCVEPQRLSRGDMVDCGTISNVFRYSHTKCYTPTMIYDMSVKHERKFFEAELMRGGEYLEYTKEILQRGRLLSVQNGNYIGSIAPYGYRKVKTGTKKNERYTLEIIPEEAEAIRLMYDVYVNQNKGFAEVCNALDRMGYKPRKANHWSPAAVKDMIENPIYIGKLRWNWRKNQKTMDNGTVKISRPKQKDDECTIVDGLHEPIISEELFEKALAKRGKNIRIKKEVECRNPYSGIVFCQCGRAMSYRPQRANGIQKAEPRLVCNGQTHCKTRSCTYPDFEAYIINVLETCIHQFEVELANKNASDMELFYENRVKQLQKELKEIESLEEEQYDLLESKVYTREVFLKRNTKLQERKASVLKVLEELEEKKSVPIDYEQKIADFNAALTALQSKDFDAIEKNMLLKKCINRITYTRPSGGRWDNEPFTCTIQLQV